jgi:hypothetical protein
MATLPNCLLSIRLLVSSANEEIVVNEPQNHTAASKEYFESKFHKTERIENTPEVKLPITLITRMLIGSVPRIKGDSAILYLRKAPATAPTASNANSIHFIFSCAHHLFSSLVGIISAFFEKGRFWLLHQGYPWGTLSRFSIISQSSRVNLSYRQVFELKFCVISSKDYPWSWII